MSSEKRETATLAGGCFWCIEAALRLAAGVEKAESGYMGGAESNPTYEAVCGGDTGHAEVARITFDPAAISFSCLLDMFFVIHDPTTLNQQGNDVGSQYRSVIFYHSGEQKRIAEEKIAQLIKDRIFDDPIVTEVTPATEFFAAENYHQEYFQKNPNPPYCRFVVATKVDKMRKQFGGKLKKA